MNKSLLFTTLLFLLVVPGRSMAFDVPPNDGFVTDAADVLSPEEEKHIEGLIRELRHMQLAEVAVLTVLDLDGDTLSAAGLAVLEKWNIGSENRNGILILFSYADRAAVIESSGLLSDTEVSGIYETDILPHIRNAQYGTGVTNAVDSLRKHLTGEYTEARYTKAQMKSSFGFIFFLIIASIVIVATALISHGQDLWLAVLIGIGLGIICLVVFGSWLGLTLCSFLGIASEYFVTHRLRKKRKRLLRMQRGFR